MKKHKSIVSLLLVTAIILGNITGTVPVHAEKNIGTEFFDNCFKTAEITETQNNNATPSAITTPSTVVATTPPAVVTPKPTKKPTPKPKPHKTKAKKQVLKVRASQSGKAHARLKWNSIKGADKYKIKISGGIKKTIKLSSRKRRYSFKIKAGKVYHVKVTALKGKKVLAHSKRVTVCQPVRVSKMRYTRLSDKKVLITWKRGKHTKQFIIYRKTGSGKYNVIGSSKKSRYVDKKISSGKNYKYIVKSINVVSKAKYSSNNRGTAFTTQKIVATSHQKYTYKEMASDISLLKRTYSKYVNVKNLGKSCDNRKIYDVVIGNQKSGRSLIVIGAIHAREYMTTQLCMAQIELYLQNYNDKIGVTSTNEVLNRIAVHYIPMANPDGVSISQSGLSAIQNASLKNALKKMPGADKTKYWKANARGVDLNKNFNYNYIAKYGGKRGSEGYTGESVNSEPETKAIVAFLDKMKSSGTLKGLINYHATGSILFGDAKGSVKPVVTKMYELAKKITGYADSSGYEESVNEHSKKKNIGNLREYAMYKKNIPCITLEIGKNACPLSAGEFYSIWKKNKVLVLKEAKLFTK